MTQPVTSPSRPSTWAVILALTLVYLSWGTTYIAIGAGVKEFPPALFGGTRLLLAGLLLTGYLILRGQQWLLPWRELGWLALVAVFMFIGGNWLITVAQKTVPSVQASVIVAMTPLWMALLEVAWPWGDRLNWKGWLGLAAGLVGVIVLLSETHDLTTLFANPAPLLVVGSALSWAVGSFILRYRPKSKSPRLAAAAWQLIFGGVALTLIGLSFGEASQVTPAKFTFPAVYAYIHLLVFGSFVGYLAYLWLLDHVSAALAGTYAYVNPVIAVFLGCWLANETFTGPMLVGMVIVLGSVALVRAGIVRSQPKPIGDPAMPSTPLGAGLNGDSERRGRWSIFLRRGEKEI